MLELGRRANRPHNGMLNTFIAALARPRDRRFQRVAERLCHLPHCRQPASLGSCRHSHLRHFTFDGPARGVRCACAIGDEIRQLGIEVRAGLHTGECEMMGEDVGGIAVHIGARVASLAGAHEVLVSSTVKDLVAGSGLRFADRGSRSLKGVPGEWHIYAVER